MLCVTFMGSECPGNVKSWRPCQEGGAIHDLGWLIQVPTAAYLVVGWVCILKFLCLTFARGEDKETDTDKFTVDLVLNLGL
jgi:hypothetical protein